MPLGATNDEVTPRTPPVRCPRPQHHTTTEHEVGLDGLGQGGVSLCHAAVDGEVVAGHVHRTPS